MVDAVGNAKRALRADLRERRQQLSAAALEAAAAGVHVQLDRLVGDLGVRSMSCFLSTTTEPGTRSFVTDAVRRGIRVLLPVTRTDGLLDWAVADDQGDVVEGLFGLPEPSGDTLSPAAVNDVDLLVIPAAAVDRTGTRLGWGRGYFDRTLGAAEGSAPVYAVIFDSELIEDVPREIHDQPVTGIVTPTRTVTLTSPTRR